MTHFIINILVSIFYIVNSEKSRFVNTNSGLLRVLEYIIMKG